MTQIILRVKDAEDIAVVAALAEEIWNQHFIGIISQGQVDYMLGKFQSVGAIEEQIAAGYEYYLVRVDDEPVGYFALVPQVEEDQAMLSKIYVKAQQRGSGLGKAMMEFVEGRCKELGIDRLWLTVNRHNTETIGFYEHLGFSKSGELLQDIGNGYVMDDYKMVKHIKQA
ncbi:MAG: GNAT family N-acetyltransferase [Sedimentisphaerales bacterium]|nr:GNAT family N-acetyltransferase [Sedimentisphaerales bacterium]